MARKRNTVTTQEDIDKLLAEKIQEYEKQHTAWIILRYGNTYVGYDICDQLTQRLMVRLRTLMELMEEEYSIKPPFGEDKEYYIILKGEDEARAKFIQQFFDNGYKLRF